MQIQPPAKNPDPKSGSGGFIQIAAPRGLLVAIGWVLLSLAFGAVAAGYLYGIRRADRSSLANAAGTNATVIGTNYSAGPGPWGELECQQSFIEVPEEYLGVRWMAAESPRWFFKGYDVARLQELLRNGGFSELELADLAATNHWEISPTGIYVLPAQTTVLSLVPTVRSRLYAELGKFEENTLQNQPFHWPAGAEESLFAGSTVAPASRALFERLSYRRGRALLFSDWATLLNEMPSEVERVAIAKTLSRRTVVFASLKLKPSADLGPLLSYWGKDSFGPNLKPVLEAATSLASGRKISVAALLPPAPRARLYTYPLESNAEPLNCHWTAFNFFKAKPDPPTERSDFWKQKLKQDYTPVSGPPRYGDLLVLGRPGQEMIHSCVFLAENLVYTKNGGSPLAPWELMTIPDLVEFYSWDLLETEQLRIQYYRARET